MSFNLRLEPDVYSFLNAEGVGASNVTSSTYTVRYYPIVAHISVRQFRGINRLDRGWIRWAKKYPDYYNHDQHTCKIKNG